MSVLSLNFFNQFGPSIDYFFSDVEATLARRQKLSMRSSILLVCLLGVVFSALAQQQIFCVINTGSCLRIRSEASVLGQSLVGCNLNI